MLSLGVLDQSPVRSGGNVADALHETLDLAELCDRLGYRRYWLAEHHSTKGLAGSSPEVLVGQVAARTSRLRVGSGGVMLQHYSWLKVAESFRVLETLFPGRIDLGVGRAPGSDGLTAQALRDDGTPERFPQQVADLLGFLHGALPEGHPFAKVVAMPTGPTAPEVWLLGSSDQSAAIAAHFGAYFSFAHFINADGGAEVTRAYRRQFRASLWCTAPRSSAAVFVVCADTDAEAQRVAKSRELFIVRLYTGMSDRQSRHPRSQRIGDGTAEGRRRGAADPGGPVVAETDARQLDNRYGLRGGGGPSRPRGGHPSSTLGHRGRARSGPEP